MRKQIRSSWIKAPAVLAAAGVFAFLAGSSSAFQEPDADAKPPLTTSPPPVAADSPGGRRVTAPVVPREALVERPADVAAIQNLTKAFVKAYNAADAAALARTFTANARIVDENHQFTEGRDAIQKRFAQRFAENPGDSITVHPDSIRFIGPDAAIEEGTATTHTPPAEETPAHTETSPYTVIYSRFDGAWLHANIRDYAPIEEAGSETPEAAEAAEAVGSNYEELKALEWLVGEWVEEGSDVLLTSRFAWTEDRNFLIRTFTLKVPGRPLLTGTQWIGWDPSTRHVRSWVFDSDGDFGEAVWIQRSKTEWVVKSSGVQHDGRTATDTRIVVRTGPDQITWQATDRTIGGETRDDTPVYSMVRRAPEPGGAKIKKPAE